MIGVTPLLDSVAETRAFLKRNGITYPTLVDPGEKVMELYGRGAYPLTVLIDSKGTIRYARTGFRTHEGRVLEQRMTAVLTR